MVMMWKLCAKHFMKPKQQRIVQQLFWQRLTKEKALKVWQFNLSSLNSCYWPIIVVAKQGKVNYMALIIHSKLMPPPKSPLVKVKQSVKVTMTVSWRVHVLIRFLQVYLSFACCLQVSTKMFFCFRFPFTMSLNLSQGRPWLLFPFFPFSVP